MSFYPQKINARFYQPKHAGKLKSTSAFGTGASFICGSFVRFYLEIQEKRIREAKFKSNGCGFAVATADFLAERITGKLLTELHGLEELKSQIDDEFGHFPEHRMHCAQICIDALTQAFADFRRFQVEEFTGEKALICTCFGVSEEQIEEMIAEHCVETVEEIGEICHAGTGCGSCQFLIREILEANEGI